MTTMQQVDAVLEKIRNLSASLIDSLIPDDDTTPTYLEERLRNCVRNTYEYASEAKAFALQIQQDTKVDV